MSWLDSRIVSRPVSLALPCERRRLGVQSGSRGICHFNVDHALVCRVDVDVVHQTSLDLQREEINVAVLAQLALDLRVDR